jgi:hypothetical protein
MDQQDEEDADNRAWKQKVRSPGLAAIVGPGGYSVEHWSKIKWGPPTTPAGSSGDSHPTKKEPGVHVQAGQTPSIQPEVMEDVAGKEDEQEEMEGEDWQSSTDDPQMEHEARQSTIYDSLKKRKFGKTGRPIWPKHLPKIYCKKLGTGDLEEFSSDEDRSENSMWISSSESEETTSRQKGYNKKFKTAADGTQEHRPEEATSELPETLFNGDKDKLFEKEINNTKFKKPMKFMTAPEGSDTYTANEAAAEGEAIRSELNQVGMQMDRACSGPTGGSCSNWKAPEGFDSTI